VLVLLIRRIYEVPLETLTYDVKYTSRFTKTRTGIQVMLKFCINRLEFRNVDVDYGKDLLCAPFGTSFTGLGGPQSV
jgi:hypothetical protein